MSVESIFFFPCTLTDRSRVIFFLLVGGYRKRCADRDAALVSVARDFEIAVIPPREAPTVLDGPVRDIALNTIAHLRVEFAQLRQYSYFCTSTASNLSSPPRQQLDSVEFAQQRQYSYFLY